MACTRCWRREQGPLLAPTPLTLAETASVFGEMLTFRALLAPRPTRKERKALLAGKVEDMLNTVVRQIAFYAFERKVHEARRKGELTHRATRRDLAGGADREPRAGHRASTTGYEVFWTYIPHFIHSPFYVYAYAFGDCLVNSLYALYQEASPGFVAEVLRDAEGRRLQASLGAAGAVRPRRARPGLLAQGPGRHRRHDRRAQAQSLGPP